MWRSASLITRWSLIQVQVAPLLPHNSFGVAILLKVLKALKDLNKAPVENDEEKRALVLASYLFHFMLKLGFAWIAYEFADFFNTYFPLGTTTIKYLQIDSVALFAIGSLGNRVDRIDTWGKKSPAELLNAKIYRLITAFGIYLTFIAYHLTPSP